MAVAIYARKSTESEDRQVQSLDDQLNALNRLAAREQLEVAEIFVESRSAKAPGTRPEFQRMMDKVSSGEIEGILTWAINRLNRNLVDGGLIAHLLQTGVLKFIRTPEKTYRPEDNVLLMSIENGMATGFIQDLSRNVKRGMQGKAERGWRPGLPPIGYLNNLLTHEIEPDKERFELIRKGWELLLSGGYTIMEVHRELTKLGLTSPTKRLENRPVSNSVFYSVFSNPFYSGSFMFNGKILPGKHTPMITKEQFRRAQEVLGRSNQRKGRVHNLVFAGLMKCGKCGCSVVGETKTKTYKTTANQVRYTYYHCTGAKGCRKIGLAESEIRRIAFDAAKGAKIAPEFRQWAEWSLRHGAQEDTSVFGQSLDQLNDLIMSLTARKATARNKLVDEVLSSEDYKEVAAEIDADIINAKKSLLEIESESEQITAYISEKLGAAEGAGDIEDLTNAGIRSVLASIGETHYLTLKKLRFNIDPVLKKIATFEPLRNGSEIPKIGDLLPLNSCWQGLIFDIRAIAREQLRQKRETRERLRNHGSV